MTKINTAARRAITAVAAASAALYAAGLLDASCTIEKRVLPRLATVKENVDVHSDDTKAWGVVYDTTRAVTADVEKLQALVKGVAPAAVEDALAAAVDALLDVVSRLIWKPWTDYFGESFYDEACQKAA